MKEVIAIVRPSKWQETRDTAEALGAQEIMNRRVLGRGHQQGLRYLRPLSGGEEGGMRYLPKRMAGWLIEDEQTDALVAAIIEVNRTNNYGDGKIFVCPVDVAAIAGDNVEDNEAGAAK